VTAVDSVDKEEKKSDDSVVQKKEQSSHLNQAIITFMFHTLAHGLIKP
jgi:hypothetical protein